MFGLVFGGQRREKCRLQEADIETNRSSVVKCFRSTTEATFCPVTASTSASQCYFPFELEKVLLQILRIIKDSLRPTKHRIHPNGNQPPMGLLRLSGGLLDEHIWDFKTRLQRLQLVNLHPRHVSLETVELEKQPHLTDRHKGAGMSQTAKIRAGNSS